MKYDGGKQMKIYEEDRYNIMRTIAYEITKGNNLVLKGGTALLLCYGLDRFSEDLDFDARRKSETSVLSDKIKDIVGENTVCLIKTAKDTPTTTRYKLDYGAENELRGLSS